MYYWCIVIAHTHTIYHTCMQVCTHTHTHAHMHACVHTHMHINTHAHTVPYFPAIHQYNREMETKENQRKRKKKQLVSEETITHSQWNKWWRGNYRECSIYIIHVPCNLARCQWDYLNALLIFFSVIQNSVFHSVQGCSLVGYLGMGLVLWKVNSFIPVLYFALLPLIPMFLCT